MIANVIFLYSCLNIFTYITCPNVLKISSSYLVFKSPNAGKVKKKSIIIIPDHQNRFYLIRHIGKVKEKNDLGGWFSILLLT